MMNCDTKIRSHTRSSFITSQDQHIHLEELTIEYEGPGNKRMYDLLTCAKASLSVTLSPASAFSVLTVLRYNNKLY